MHDLVPVRVVIGMKVVNGRVTQDYPDFNKLPVVKASAMDWAYYVDKEGSGWLYDSVCGHCEELPGEGSIPPSPRGMQLGVLLVPKQFADEAVAMFAECQVISEAACQEFYEKRVSADQPAVDVDQGVLSGMAAKVILANALRASDPVLAAKLDLSPEDKRCLDPDMPERGCRRNPRKSWEGFKKHAGVRIVHPSSPGP